MSKISEIAAYCGGLLPYALGSLFFAVGCVVLYAKYKFRKNQNQ